MESNIHFKKSHVYMEKKSHSNARRVQRRRVCVQNLKI